MCTSGIMYEPEELEADPNDLPNIEVETEQVEVADEVKERVCNYSGLLSVKE